MIIHQRERDNCFIPVIPRVSVIIPVYNTDEYLHQCLDSILTQSLKNIEIICIDDGSSDGSLKILYEYQKKDNRIKIITQKNLGPGPSRNKGISVATGEFIAFMDSDDWYPDKDILETMYDTAIKNQVAICGGSAVMWKKGKVITKFKGKNSGQTFNKDGVCSYSKYQYPWGYWRFLYQRDLLTENNLQFPNYRRGQDPPFFVNTMIVANKFYTMTKITYCYRISHKKTRWSINSINDYLKSTIDLLEISKKQNFSKLYTFPVKIFISTYLKGILKGLDKDNKQFTELVSRYNEITNNNNRELHTKNTIINDIIIDNYFKILLRCSTEKRARRILSCIKCGFITLYWELKDKIIQK